MNFLPEDIEAFAERFTTKESALLYELNKFTHTNVLQPRMLAGHLQGRVIAMLSRMIKPKTVLEIGTYTGYSALCWAEGLSEGGSIHTIEIDDELESKILSFIKRSAYSNNIHLHIGDAIEVIPSIAGEFDLVYLDADKSNYPKYFDLVIDRIPVGGYLIADNVLWSGKVVGPIGEMDTDTLALLKYVEKVNEDDRLENVLLPIRDGFLIAQKTK